MFFNNFFRAYFNSPLVFFSLPHFVFFSLNRCYLPVAEFLIVGLAFAISIGVVTPARHGTYTY